MNGDFVADLQDVVVGQFSDIRFDFRVDNLRLVGNGSNMFVSRRVLFPRAQFVVTVAEGGFDESSPRSCFELAQAAFHEAHHVRHHVERMRGNRSALSDKFTFAYLAREQNDMRYDLGYPDNIFELDANAYSVVEAKRFCKQFFPGVDFDEIACDVWRKRCESGHTRFVTDWADISSAEDIAAHMRTRIMTSDCDAHTVMCRCGDAVWDYLHTRASYTFCDLWKNADSDLVRDKLCAAVLVGSGFSSALYPNVDALDWHVGDVDVLADVRAHQKVLGIPRGESEWSSEVDVLQALGSAIESGLSLSSARTGPFDYVSINRHGMSVEHRAYEWTGPRRESEVMGKHVIEVALAGLANGSLVPFSGRVPDVVCERVGCTFSCVVESESEKLPPTPIRTSADIRSDDKIDVDDFGLG